MLVVQQSRNLNQNRACYEFGFGHELGEIIYQDIILQPFGIHGIWRLQLDIFAKHKQTEDMGHMAPFNKINILARKQYLKFHIGLMN